MVVPVLETLDKALFNNIELLNQNYYPPPKDGECYLTKCKVE